MKKRILILEIIYYIWFEKSNESGAAALGLSIWLLVNPESFIDFADTGLKFLNSILLYFLLFLSGAARKG